MHKPPLSLLYLTLFLLVAVIIQSLRLKGAEERNIRLFGTCEEIAATAKQWRDLANESAKAATTWKEYNYRTMDKLRLTDQELNIAKTRIKELEAAN